MIKNYITIAVRNMRKYTFYTAINIFGLAVGVTACLYIALYVSDELSYDRFHADAENIYRVGLHGRISGQEIYTTNSSMPLGPTLLTDVPGIEEMLRLIPATRGSGLAFRYNEKVFTEDKIFYADSNFYSFFSFQLERGDSRTVLTEPNSMVITRALAEKYFGDEEPIGKIIVVGNDKWPCKITGIAAEAPSNSHFHFQALISFVTIEKDFFPGWTGNSMQTYVRKNAATSVAEINTKLEEVVARHIGKELEEGLGISFDEFKKQGGIYSYVAYPLVDSHLRSSFQDDIEPSSDIQYVYVFSAVGVFILIIACINFMNLSTARSANRAKEVGLRKTLGSHRTQMVTQFLAESFTYSVIAVTLAVLLCYLLLPYFNLLSGKQLTLALFIQPVFLFTLLGLTIFIGLIAGSYPAFYLTSFNTVEVLKGKVRAGLKSKGVRSTLVVVQFSVSTFLIISTVVVYRQLNYMQGKNLGLDKENVITVSNTRRLGQNAEAFEQAVEGLSHVKKASFTNNTFPGMDNTTVFRQQGSDKDHLMGLYYTDWDHLDVMRLTMKEGRFFSRDFVTDSSACILNEAAVRELGLNEAVNTELTDFQGTKPEQIRVIGVVSDFNFESLKTIVRPVVIRLTDTRRNLMIRYEGSPQEAVTAIEKTWKQMAAGEPFEYTFLDQDFDQLFREEQRLGQLFSVLTGLAIFIACLGLFALAAFTAEQRTKEIGIRKAMGAGVLSITTLLSREFTLLVIASVAIAAVPAYFLLDSWLGNFAYHAELGWLVFVGSGLAALIIAWATVSFQAFKAARAKPIDSLRYE